MNKLGLLALVLLSLFQVSCTQNYIERIEGRIVGDWYFSRVRITEPFNIDNVTSDYNEATMTFHDDYSVTYIQDNGDMLEGTWTFNIVNGSEENINQLVLDLVDANGEDYLLLWDNFSVWRDRMDAREDIDWRTQINYRLRRL